MNQEYFNDKENSVSQIQNIQEQSVNQDFSLSDVAPKNLDPIFLNLEETNEFEKRIERNK
jgi:hypothetical protein